jgi:glycosyltransferase involved in cell wall biosynthesis
MKKSMRIVFDARTASDHFPGIGRYVVSLARALKMVAPDLELTLLRDPRSTGQRLVLPDVPTVACAASPFSIEQQWVVPGMLRSLGAAVYHSPYYLMPYRPGAPAVLTAHDLIPLVYPRFYTPAQRLVFRWAHGLAVRTARVTVAVSSATRTDLMERLGARADRLVVIPEAADPRFAPQPAAAIQAARDKYALPDRYVLYVGSNKPHKNLELLVRAWNSIVTSGQTGGARLVIAGHWDLHFPQARGLAERLNLGEQIRFAGPIPEDDLPAVYAGARLFVFPSLYEGFGLPALEAMACGAPVVCSSTSSLPEVVGDAALTMDPLDEQALASAMARVLRDDALREEMRARGIARAAEFSWERTARATLEVYRLAAAGQGGGAPAQA